MAKDKTSFVFYCDWKSTFDELPDDKAGQLIKHILAYVSDENPETDDVLIRAVFAGIKSTLKRDLRKWESYIEKQRENGKRGGRPKKPKKPKPFLENPTKPKKADSVSVSVSDSEINIPASEEFIAYAKEKKNNVSKDAVRLKYQAWKENGWKDGNGKDIKNWKTKLLNTLPYLPETKTNTAADKLRRLNNG